MPNPFVGYDNIIPLYAPVQTTTGTVTTPYMDLRGAQRASFLLYFGVITSATTTDEVVVTVDAATAEDGTEVAQSFYYRLSAIAAATATWGAVTSCASTGFGMGADDSDNMMLWVQLDLDDFGTNDFRYARIVVTPSPATQLEALIVSICGIQENRYKQTTFHSVTASASV